MATVGQRQGFHSEENRLCSESRRQIKRKIASETKSITLLFLPLVHRIVAMVRPAVSQGWSGLPGSTNSICFSPLLLVHKSLKMSWELEKRAPWLLKLVETQPS